METNGAIHQNSSIRSGIPETNSTQPIVVTNTKSNRKGIFIAFGLFLIGLLILGGMYAYFYYYLSPHQVLYIQHLFVPSNPLH